MVLIAWAAIGIIAGIVAKYVVPVTRHHRLISLMETGALGGGIGGFMGGWMLGLHEFNRLNISTILGAIVGAVILIDVYHTLAGRRVLYLRITSKRRCIAVLSVLWLVLAALVVVSSTTGPGSFHLKELHRLSEEGVQIRGTVTEQEPHRPVRYAYRVEGRDYEGVAREGHGHPPFGKIEVGQSVPVYYLPTEPDISCLGEPTDLYDERIHDLVSAALVLPTFGVIVYAFALCRLKASSE